MAERGLIVNREFATQVRDFSGLRFPGGITPTDIDGFLDFGGKLFVKIEFKYGAGILPYGQKLALERLCDACERGGVPSLILVAVHNDKGDIKCAEAEVVELRWRGQWRKPRRGPLSVRDAIDGFLKSRLKRAA